MNTFMRIIVITAFCGAVSAASGGVALADPFLDAVTNASLMRDLHIITATGSRIGSADTEDGQTTGISAGSFFAGADLWNNEHNQALGGLQYGRREFDREIVMPGGFSIPKHVDTASAGLVFKHITSGDWSLNQGARFTRYQNDMPSTTVRDSFDVVGLAAISPEPGISWAFGYLYDQSDYIRPVLVPVLEYVNTAHDQWTIVVGYPMLTLAVAPHPDWGMSTSGGINVSYKVTELNFLSASLTGDNWAYRLEGRGMKSIEYAAQRAGLAWTYLYVVSRRTAASLNASLGWEFNRKIGPEDGKVRIGDALVAGINAGLSF